MDGLDSPSRDKSTLKSYINLGRREKSMRKTLIANLWFSPRLKHNIFTTFYV